jgi:hypothetical protein
MPDGERATFLEPDGDHRAECDARAVPAAVAPARPRRATDAADWRDPMDRLPLPDYWLPRPVGDPAPNVRAAFETVWRDSLAAGDCPSIDGPLPAPTWQFLCYLADEHGLALHGSGNPSITRFEPRQADDLSPFGNQRAVYAAGDGIWAMFFAVADRDRIGSITNACVRLVDAAGHVGAPRYVFSVSRSALPGRPWRSGTVYVLPRETFVMQPPLRFGDFEVRVPQLASSTPVTPLARVPVVPADFPLLDAVRGHDDERLADYARALETGAPWPV